MRYYSNCYILIITIITTIVIFCCRRRSPHSTTCVSREKKCLKVTPEIPKFPLSPLLTAHVTRLSCRVERRRHGARGRGGVWWGEVGNPEEDWQGEGTAEGRAGGVGRKCCAVIGWVIPEGGPDCGEARSKTFLWRESLLVAVLSFLLLPGPPATHHTCFKVNLINLLRNIFPRVVKPDIPLSTLSFCPLLSLFYFFVSTLPFSIFPSLPSHLIHIQTHSPSFSPLSLTLSFLFFSISTLSFTLYVSSATPTHTRKMSLMGR